MEINSTKTQTKCDYDDLLNKLLSTDGCKGVEELDTSKTPSSADNGEPKEPIDKWKWRHMSTVCMEEMIISSYGDEFLRSLNVAKKLRDNTIEEKDMPLLARKELDLILDKCNSTDESALKYFCTDFPSAQFSREYYFDRIKIFLTENKTGGGMHIDCTQLSLC